MSRPYTLLNATTQIFRGDILWLSLIFLLVFFLRLPYAPEPIIEGWDESVYFTVSQELVNGEVLYKTTWDHKGPLLYFIFVPVIKLFGNSVTVLHVFTTIYLLISLLFIYLIARILIGSQVSLFPPLVYGLFFTTSKFEGLQSNSELFMMLPLLMATFCFIQYRKKEHNSRVNLFLCGFFSSAAFFIKPVALFSAILFPTMLIIEKLRSKELKWRFFTKNLLWYMSGVVLITGSVLIYFVLHGAVYELYHGLIWFNNNYVNTISVQTGLENLILFLKKSLNLDIITIIAFCSFLFIIIRPNYTQEQKKNAYFITGLFVLSLVGVFWGRNMYPHYFLQMSLPVGLIIAFAISLTEIRADHLKKIAHILIITLILVKILPVSEIFDEYKENYERYKKSDLYKVSEYIVSHTSEQDKIFVLGGQPIIYFLSDRRSPTKYFFWHFHTEKVKNILQLENPSLMEFHHNKPTYIIYSPQGSQIKYLEKFMTDNYHIETKIGDSTLYKIN